MSEVDISVCIPTYNGADFLAETLASVEAQQFRGRIEVIVSDDGSSDDTLGIVENFAERSKFPYIILNHVRQGIGANWDHSIASSRGSYIKLLMQDDIIYPQHLSSLFDVMEADSRIGIGFVRRDIIKSGNGYDEWIAEYGNLHDGWDQQFSTGRISGRTLLRDRNFLNFPPNKIGEPSAVLLRRAAINETGGFSRTLSQSLDYEYWYRLLVRYDAYFLDEALCAFRRHEAQLTTMNSRSTQEVEDFAQLQLYRSYLRNLVLHLNWRDRVRLCKEVLRLTFV
jgi:glycosyltransferase involved in cell wall biosynthesis